MFDRKKIEEIIFAPENLIEFTVPEPANPEPKALAIVRPPEQKERLPVARLGFNEIKKEFLRLEEQEILDYAFPERGYIESQIAIILNSQKKLTEKEKQELKQLQRKLRQFKLTERQRAAYCARFLASVFEEIGSGLKFYLEERSFYFYNLRYWEKLPPELLFALIKITSEKLRILEKEFITEKFKNQIIKELETELLGFEPNFDESQNCAKINLANGTLIVTPENGIELYPFRKEDYFVYANDYDYQPEAFCPLFEKFLNRVLPDKSSQKRLKQHVAYLFLRHGKGNFRLDKIPILLGSGSNGKSVFQACVIKLLGKHNCTEYTLSQLSKSEYNRAAIVGKLVNFSSELGAGSGIDSDFFKKAASGESIQIRHPYGRAASTQNYPKMLFNANKLPTTLEKTEGVLRRLDIFAFDVYIPKEEQDPDLEKKLEEELSGILNFFLSELPELLTNKKLAQSESVSFALAKFRTELDPQELFLVEYPLVSGDYPVLAQKVRNAFENFYMEEFGNKNKITGRNKFFSFLRSKGLKIDNSTGNNLNIFLDEESSKPFRELAF